MTTLAIMLAEIQADTGRSATAQVTAMRNKISAAIRHYQPHRFYFNESRSITFSMVAGTDTYDFGTGQEIATEFYRVDGVYVTIATGDVREMTRRNYTDLEVLAGVDTTTGEPSDYAYINKALRFWRSPDDTYSTRVIGHVKAAEPATDGEANNPWMVEAYDLIMARAKAELYAHKWEDPNNAALMVQAEASALRSLQSATDDRVQLGYLEATEF